MPLQVHHRVLDWLQKNYPRPQVDPDWLNDCLKWLMNQHLSPDDNPNQFFAQLEGQLLLSDLRDSMLHGTGLPTHIALPDTTTTLSGHPVLVEIASITEIAHSAFSLDQIRAAREERARSGHSAQGNEDEEGDIDVDEGPPPKYPRGMLKLELTDGAIILPAIEYRRLQGLSLGVTPLGFKMLLKNVKIRNGIAWLEPDCVTMKAHSAEDMDVNQASDFARDLKKRMGLPIDNVLQAVQLPTTVVSTNMRSPLRDISPPPPPEPLHNDDESLENRKRRIPSSSSTLIDSSMTPTLVEDRPIASSSRVASAALHTGASTSPYFPPSASQKRGPRMSNALNFERCSIIDTPEGDDAGEVENSHTNRRSERQADISKASDSPETSTAPDNSHLASSRETTRPTGQGSNELGLPLSQRPKDRKGKGKAETINISDEEDNGFENDFFMNQEFLESLDRVEMQALHAASTSNGAAPSPSSISASTLLDTRTKTLAAQDVIDIADDEEGEDKENIPVATRHVRRRTEFGGSDLEPELGAKPVLSGDVIDLSDSD
ncbi:hypothetical protein AX17_002301 [Amanita inopinata Kibby_2008]|nr:hypothetical protein AX17_002301 [Amanita inopinata Kibby_2008]